MRAELKVPLQFSGIGVKSQQATGVEIVAGANAAVVVGGGIARSPVKSVQVRIIGAGHPCRAAAVQIGVARPALVALFTGTGNGPEVPLLLAGLGVERGEKAPYTIIAAGCSNKDFVF